MPGFVTAQPPRKEDRSHAQPSAGLLGPSMASMARTGLEWPRLRGAEGGVEPARPCPALHSKISRRAVWWDGAAAACLLCRSHCDERRSQNDVQPANLNADTWRASGPARAVGGYHAARIRAGRCCRSGNVCCGLCRACIPRRPRACRPGCLARGCIYRAWWLALLCQPCGLRTLGVNASVFTDGASERRRHSAFPQRP